MIEMIQSFGSLVKRSQPENKTFATIVLKLRRQTPSTDKKSKHLIKKIKKGQYLNT